MVELNSDRLTESYLNFIAIKESLAYVQKESFRRNDDAFLNTIGFPYVNQSIKDRKALVNSKMEEMVNSMDELIVLGLVSDFEKIVFDRLENASGEISKIVKEKYKGVPFNKFSLDFVKTAKEIDKLSVIKSIISPKLPVELVEKFAEVVEFRNRLAHGKRFGKQSMLTYDEIAQTLDDVLNFI